MNQNLKIILGAGLLGCFVASSNAQVDITRWGFTAAATPVNNPTPSFGTGTASIIGMNGNAPLGDVVQTGTVTAPDPNALSTGLTWRVRGATANGWQSTADEFTQGAQLMASTVGFTNIMFDFDWFSTNNGIRNLQVQYTLDGSTWNNYQGTFAGGVSQVSVSGVGTQLLATPNNYNAAGATATFNEADFSSVAGAANNANFGVRIVSAKDLTLGGYAAATLASGAPVLWNGLSGNWRFDQLAFRGTASTVPEPAAFAVLGLGLFGLVRRKRKNA
jgi:hypothetical protein